MTRALARGGDGRLVWRPVSSPLEFVRASWRGLELRQLRFALLVGLGIGTLQGIGAALTQTDLAWWQSLLACAYPGAVLGVIWRFCVALADHTRTVHSRRWIPYVIAGVTAALISMTIDMATTPAFAPLDGVYLFGWEALRHHTLELWWSNLPGLCLASSFAALAYLHFGEARLRAEKLRSVQLERARLARHTHESRLLATQARVDPEFLFDSLERVRDLYEHDPATAERMLDDLIVYLRAALPSLAESTSTLRTEFAIAGAWLDIMQIRLGGRLSFAVADPVRWREARMPPMVLLPLVEHAIEDVAIATHRSVRIDIAASVTRDRLRVVISASTEVFLMGQDADANRRIGERLRTVYGSEATLVFRARDGGGSQAILEIPHELPERHHR
ncbi:MAG: histidine kinase [Betaproteobacteria bacterium]